MEYPEKNKRGNRKVLKCPHNMPMAVFIQEADTLYHWALEDKDALVDAGLAGELILDLPARCETAAKAEADWYVQQNNKKQGVQEWEKHAFPAFELRKQLLQLFRFAFRSHPHLLKNLRFINTGCSHAKGIQDLNDLAVLGKANRPLLEAVHFDMTLLDKAAQASADLSTLLANATSDRMAPNEAKIIRDQAYTALKEAVDQIRFYGRFVFRNNKERLIGYRSEFLRQLKMKQARKKRRNVLAADEREQTGTKSRTCARVSGSGQIN